MKNFHGTLLIGGMSLKDVDVFVDSNETEEASWSGRASVAPESLHALETGRQYRLETDDGRAAQLLVTDIRIDPDRKELILVLEGLSPLT